MRFRYQNFWRNRLLFARNAVFVMAIHLKRFHNKKNIAGDVRHFGFRTFVSEAALGCVKIVSPRIAPIMFLCKIGFSVSLTSWRKVFLYCECASALVAVPLRREGVTYRLFWNKVLSKASRSLRSQIFVYLAFMIDLAKFSDGRESSFHRYVREVCQLDIQVEC